MNFENSYSERLICEGLTFDDVLLVPAESDVLPPDVVLSTKLTKTLTLNTPIMSAAMDTTRNQMSCAATVAPKRDAIMAASPPTANHIDVSPTVAASITRNMTITAIQSIQAFAVRKAIAAPPHSFLLF